MSRPGCFNLYMFNRDGVCLYYHEWYRPKPLEAGTPANDQKNVFGTWGLSNPRITVEEQTFPHRRS
jgi:trafficking protein particle complex subunit 1